jgi:ribosomal protein L34E
MGRGVLNAMHQNLSGKIGRIQQQAEQSNIFKAVNRLYGGCIANVLIITVIKMAFINLSERYKLLPCSTESW